MVLQQRGDVFAFKSYTIISSSEVGKLSLRIFQHTESSRMDESFVQARGLPEIRQKLAFEDIQ